MALRSRLPALTARRMQTFRASAAGAVGFDWPDIAGSSSEKLDEELGEFDAAQAGATMRTPK